MKKIIKVVLCVLIALALLCTAFCLAFPDAVKTLEYFFKYSSAQSQEQMNKTNEEIYNSFFNSLTPEEFEGLTEEELELITSGALSEEEMLALVLSKIEGEKKPEDTEQTENTENTGNTGNTEPEKKEEDTPVQTEPEQNDGEKAEEVIPKPEPEPKPEPDPEPKPEPEPEPDVKQDPEKEPEEEPKKDISVEKAKLVTKLYSLKTNFTKKLEDVINGALQEFSALPEEKRTSTEKKKILRTRLSEIAALEKECDAKVEEIANELTNLLKENGESLELVESLRAAYKEEKALKRSYYISKATGN